MALPNTIAVDGPAGSGKSTVSFAVAQQIGYLFADTGAFYRAITLLALEQHLDFTNANAIVQLAQQVQLDMTSDLDDDNRQYTILANRRDITPHIHTPDVDAHVSTVAALSGVRTALLDVQRTIAARGRVIMAGRDIGTVVLPNADLKIFYDASLEKRASRRHQQLMTNGESADLTTVRNGINQRDTLDSKRSTAPLLQAPDAVYLDTSMLSFEEAVEALQQIILEWSPTK